MFNSIPFRSGLDMKSNCDERKETKRKGSETEKEGVQLCGNLEQQVPREWLLLPPRASTRERLQGSSSTEAFGFDLSVNHGMAQRNAALVSAVADVDLRAKQCDSI